MVHWICLKTGTRAIKAWTPETQNLLSAIIFQMLAYIDYIDCYCKKTSNQGVFAFQIQALYGEKQ